MQANVVLTSIEPTFSTRILCWVQLQNASCKRDKADGASSSFQRSAIAEHATVSAKGIHLSIQNLWKACSCSAYLSGALGENDRAEGRRHEARRPAGHWSALFDEEPGGQGGPLGQTWNNKPPQSPAPTPPKNCEKTPANTLKGPKQPRAKL